MAPAASIGAGHEEDPEHQERQDRHGEGQRELVEEEEHAHGRVGDDALGYPAAPHPVEVDGGPPEDGHPHKGDHARDENGAQGELADGAPAREADDKQAHERAPGDPPRPVGDGPGAQPGVVLVEGTQPPHARGDDAAQVVADPLRQGAELGGRGADDEEDGEQDGGHVHADLAQVVDPLLDRRRGRYPERDRGDADDDELRDDAGGGAEGLAEPGGELEAGA